MELEDEFPGQVEVVGNEKPPRSSAFEVTIPEKGVCKYFTLEIFLFYS